MLIWEAKLNISVKGITITISFVICGVWRFCGIVSPK